MTLSTVGIDGDDTLWLHGRFFVEARHRVLEIVSRYVNVSKWAAALTDAEQQNLQLYGYGVKSFALSHIEAAINATNSQIGADDIASIIRLCKEMLNHEIEVLEETRALLKELRSRYRLLLITKGDDVEQLKKIEKADVSGLFDAIEIVHNKNERVYRRILETHGVEPNEFAMIGDSIRSDVIPVLNVGAWAIHVPSEVVWDHEGRQAPTDHDHYIAIASMEGVPEAIDTIERKAGMRIG
jgi:putative hydrolase of the HAD superfamily